MRRAVHCRVLWSRFCLGHLTKSLLVILRLTSVLSLPNPLVTPACKVNNIVLQPHYGISAKTKNLVDIVQVPPLFTQSIQIGICDGYSDEFKKGDRTLNNLPHYICRQRYKGVEVYSKSIKQREVKEDAESKAHFNISQPWLSREFVKDFVLVESGCDFFFNFLPLLRSSSGRVNNGLHGGTPEKLGISSISGATTLHEQSVNQGQNQDVPNYYTSLDNERDFRTRPLVKANFFRRGLHLNFGAEEVQQKTAVENASVSSSDGYDNGPAIPTMNHTQSPMEGERNESHRSVDTVIGSSNGNTDDILNYEGEMEIRPEELGLPILILEASMDPVMKILSYYDPMH